MPAGDERAAAREAARALRAAKRTGSKAAAAEVPTSDTVTAYSVWCPSCDQAARFDEITDNRIVTCSQCGEMVPLPDSLGQEPGADEDADAPKKAPAAKKATATKTTRSKKAVA